MFPQLAGLGRSHTASCYGISGLEEARAYLEDDLLGTRLRRMVAAAIKCGVHDAHALFGSPDDLNFRSCLTLFNAEDPSDFVFREALKVFFGGERCVKTLEMLKGF